MDLLIDTDPAMGTLGCDPEDSLAIAMALASPEVTVRAITCVQGNVPVRHSYANAAHVLKLLDRADVPLAADQERPLLGARRRQQLRWLAETDGYQRVIPAAPRSYPQPRAVELILRTARESDGLAIVAIGPLTNVAAALVADPALVDRLERVTVMGGAFEVPGNITPTAEFNFFMDPEAAQIVLESGVRPVLVGLDVCHRTHLTRRQVAATRFTSELGRFVQHACSAWLPADGTDLDDGPYLYDSLALAAAVRPELLTLEPAFVRIETTSDALAGTSAAWLPGVRRPGRAPRAPTTPWWPPPSTSPRSRPCSASGCWRSSEAHATAPPDAWSERWCDFACVGSARRMSSSPTASRSGQPSAAGRIARIASRPAQGDRDDRGRGPAARALLLLRAALPGLRGRRRPLGVGAVAAGAARRARAPVRARSTRMRGPAGRTAGARARSM